MKSNSAGQRLILFVFLSGWVWACGAKYDEAKQEDLDAQVLSLTEKVSHACDIVNKQASAPNFQELELGSFCSGQKSPANLGDHPTIGFSSVTDKALTFANGDQVRSLHTQTEIWLNRDMFDLVKRFKEILNKPEDEVVETKKVEKKVLDLKVIEKAKIDKKNMRLTLRVHIESPRQKNGFLNVSNELYITAQLLEGKYIVVTAETVGVTPVDVSLFRGLKAAVMVVPHAQDMYLGIITRIDLHSYGEGVDKKTKNIILGVIQDALKKIPEALGELE